MTPRETSQQIEGLRRQTAALTKGRVMHQDGLARLLTVEARFFNQRDVDDARAVLARIDRDVANLTERIAALTEQLPTAEARAATETKTSTLRALADAAIAEFPLRWDNFLAALDAAEVAARDLARVRSSADMAISSLTEIVRDNGLRVAAPTPPSPGATQSELARHITLLLTNVAEGVEPDATVEKYLALLRAQVATPV